jgi:hypothetical protein
MYGVGVAWRNKVPLNYELVHGGIAKGPGNMIKQ